MRTMRLTLLPIMVLAALLTLTIEASAFESLEGVWDVHVTILGACGPSGIPVNEFPSMITFTRDRKVIEVAGTPLLGPVPVLRLSPGLGTWQHRQGHHSTAAFTFFRVNVPANTFAGTQTITEDIELSGDGNEFTATGTSEVRDAGGNVILTGCNTLTGNRID